MQNLLHKTKIYPYLIIILSSFLLFYKYVTHVFPGLIISNIMASFNISAHQSGYLIATTFWTILVIQIFAGIIIDKYGFRLITAFSLIISSLGILIFIYAANHNNLMLAYISRIVIGIGISFATVSYIKAISVWISSKNIPLAMSFLASAAMIGAIIGQMPFVYLINKVGSWQAGLKIFAFIGLIIAIIYFLIVRDYKDISEKHNSNTSFKAKNIKYVFFNFNNWLLTLYSGLSFSTINVFAGLWGNNYFITQYKISVYQSSQIVSMIFLGVAIGSPLVGKLSEYYKISYKFLMITLHILAILFICIALFCQLSIFCISLILFLFGLCLGGYMLSFVIARKMNNINISATVISFINMGEPICSAIFDPLIGYLLELNWKGYYINVTSGVITKYILNNELHSEYIKYFTVTDYRYSFLVLIISLIFAFLCLCFIKFNRNSCK